MNEKKTRTKLLYQDSYLSIQSDVYNYVLIIKGRRFNYGTIKGLFYAILRKKLKNGLNQEALENVVEFREIVNKAVEDIRSIAMTITDWK